VAKASYDLKHNKIVGFEDIFFEDESFLRETPLEDSCDE